MKTHKITCPVCYGFGFIPISMINYIACKTCKGAGFIRANPNWRLFGDYMRRYRIDVLRMTLRQAVKQYHIDPSNLSKMERGLIKPKKYWEVKDE